MSCFVVTPYHINAIVSWAAHAQCLEGQSPDALAWELYQANTHAFNERYEGRYASEVEAWPGFELVPALDPIAIVKACDCLDYQACDWTAWRESHPGQVLEGIRAAALVAVTGLGSRLFNLAIKEGAYELPGYDAAAWCLDAAQAQGGQA